MTLSLLDAIAQHYHGEWGFTGTRKGMTIQQQQHLRTVIRAGLPTQFHHGGAFGADYESHAIWREEMRGRAALCVVWPADDKRAQLFQRQNHVRVQPVMDPLVRNREITKYVMLLVAAPHTEQEEQRSGTWATIRSMLVSKKPVLILWPGGRQTLCREGVVQRLVDR